MENNTVKIESSWKNKLLPAFQAESFSSLKNFLIEEKKKYTIYPNGNKMFSAFNLCSFDKTKVVIIGQDPYHGPNQANGLCFSVSDGINPPPSLKNIFKEIRDDIGDEIPHSGNLEHWAKQGVLMLNATLTVRAKQAGSHQKKGWEEFTDFVIKTLSKDKEGLVFLLWGRFAQNKAELIDSNKHHILTAAHPSPFSAHSGFFGCKHFSKTNTILSKQYQTQIKWFK
ncbi:MAG: uracil-DNA glycosylase [Flavobacteriales bacterium]|nr:uracil-DNA glycosylase [Flavobacteriales bacterium]